MLDLQPTVAGPPAVESHPGPLIRRGAELVHLCEQLYVGMFTLAFGLLGVAGVFSVPLAQANPLERERFTTVLFSILALFLASTAIARRRGIYLWLRKDRAHQLAPGLLAAVIVLASGPYSPCWWIATALLLIVTTVSTAGPTLIVGALTSAAYVTGTLLRGKSLLPAGDTEYLTVTASLAVNPLIARAVIESFARFVLRLHKLEQEALETRQPIRVSAIVHPDETARTVMPHEAARAVTMPAEANSAPSATNGQAERIDTPIAHESSVLRRAASRLTARQLQVILLARDGLHQPEIAACLGISPRQVERHLEQARKRTGATTTAHLVAMLMRNQLAPADPELD